MKNLTDRQKEVLDFIAQFTEENVFPPTVREIGDHFQISLHLTLRICLMKDKHYLMEVQVMVLYLIMIQMKCLMRFLLMF